MKHIYTVEADGELSSVECEMLEHPSGYGNGKMIAMRGRVLPFGKIVLDVRYANLEELGGFESVCKAELEARGLAVIS